VAARALGFTTRVSRSISKLWREAAKDAGIVGLEVVEGGLAGWAGGLRVHLSRFSYDERYGTRVVVSGPGLLPDLTLRRESAATARQRRRGVREIEVGDEEFDRTTWVLGQTATTRAILDAETRLAVRCLLQGFFERSGVMWYWAIGEIEAGRLQVDLPEVSPPLRGAGPKSPVLAGRAAFPGALQATMALARRLVTPADIPRRLLENATRDPEPAVRGHCLMTLVGEFEGHPAARQALLAGREDPDAEVRLRAAIGLGPEGRDVLLALALGEGAEDQTTERAVAGLGASLTTDEAEAILRNALRTRREATARACLGALGRRGGPQAIRMLVRVLTVERGPLAVAAASALGETGDVLAEPPLLRMLQNPAASLRDAAARALGRVGTVAAVGALRDLEARDAGSRPAARQAVAEIQSRVAGAAPGQLSLAGGDSGRLSLAGDEPGRLSFPDSSSTTPQS
jgi:hypothetical protein